MKSKLVKESLYEFNKKPSVFADLEMTNREQLIIERWQKNIKLSKRDKLILENKISDFLKKAGEATADKLGNNQKLKGKLWEGLDKSNKEDVINFFISIIKPETLKKLMKGDKEKIAKFMQKFDIKIILEVLESIAAADWEGKVTIAKNLNGVVEPIYRPVAKKFGGWGSGTGSNSG